MSDNIRLLRDSKDSKESEKGNSFVDEYKTMDSFCVFIAFGVCDIVENLGKECANDVYEFMHAKINKTLPDLENKKGKDWMILTSLLLHRSISFFMSKNRKVLCDICFLYDIQDGMFDYEDNIIKIMLNINRQREKIFNKVKEECVG